MTDNGNTGTTPKGRDGDYEEIHAAIQELYRLMGAPRQAPAAPGDAYHPGYLVYTYGAPGTGYVPGWPAQQYHAPPGTPGGPLHAPALNQQHVAASPYAPFGVAGDPRFAAWGHGLYQAVPIQP